MNSKVVSEISLDVANSMHGYRTVWAKQGDNLSRFIRAKIMSNGEVLSISDNSKVYINFKRYDGTTKSYEGDIENAAGGILYFPLPFWALELPYIVLCDVSIIEDDTHKLTTFCFYISVESAAVSDDDVQSSDDGIFLLQKIKEIEQISNEVKTIAANVTTKIDETMAELEKMGSKSFFKQFTKTDFIQVGTARRYYIAIKQSEHKLKNPYVDKVLINNVADDEEDTSSRSAIVVGEKTLSTGTIKIYVTIDLSKYSEYSGIIYLKGE